MSTGRFGRWSAIAAGAAALLVPAGAQAANPACGSTVTHDVKLTADMDCSASNTDGIDVGKSGITINLNGHSITGPDNNSYDGVDNEGYDDVTLENGSITGYEYGVFFEYTSGSKILHVHAGDTSSNTYSGISFWYSKNGKIDHSTATAGTNGNYPFYLYENTKVNLVNSQVKDANANGYGVYDYYSKAKIKNVKSNGGYYGFYIEEPLVQGYTIKDSTANGNSSDGFYIYENYPTALYQATLTDNRANNNGEYGFYADVTAKGSRNRATGNGTANCFHVPCGH